MSGRVTGKVKWFNNAKGYGFIALEGGEDLFAHFSEIDKDKPEAFKSLEENEEVEFEITDGKKGQQASNIKRLAK